MKTLSITILSVAALAGLASVATASAAEARDVLTPAAQVMRGPLVLAKRGFAITSIINNNL